MVFTSAGNASQARSTEVGELGNEMLEKHNDIFVGPAPNIVSDVGHPG